MTKKQLTKQLERLNHKELVNIVCQLYQEKKAEYQAADQKADRLAAQLEDIENDIEAAMYDEVVITKQQ